MNDDVLNRVRTLRVGTWHGRRSPHKPLLLLLSIGRHSNGHERLSAFGDIEEDLNSLIRRFGLPNNRENAYLPFWHLRNDGLWEIDRPDLVRMTTSGHAFISDLREHRIRGGITQEVLSVLERNPGLALCVVQSLLNDYFPPSLHADVLRGVGLAGKIRPSGLTFTKSKYERRDRNFRNAVLRAYKVRCALCDLDLRVDEQPIGLEAAHIKWHSVGGPSVVANGIALCALHHKFFDSGLFTLTADLTVLVGGIAEGESVEQLLNKYGGLMLPVFPDSPDERPGSKYLEWHSRAVFRAT